MDVKEIRERIEYVLSINPQMVMDGSKKSGDLCAISYNYKMVLRPIIDALSTIDPEAIKRTVLLDAIKSISILNQMSVESSINDDYLIGYGFGVRDCQIKLESILQAEPGPR